MSLLDEAMEDCTIIEKRTVPDGYGGWSTEWYDGSGFSAAVVLNSSLEAKIAESQGVTGIYTVTTEKALNLQYHDVFRRESDKKIFRVTSDGDDDKTPASAGLDMRQVSAEEWRLHDEQSTST